MLDVELERVKHETDSVFVTYQVNMVTHYNGGAKGILQRSALQPVVRVPLLIRGGSSGGARLCSGITVCFVIQF
jgi:hypothetical protein